MGDSVLEARDLRKRFKNVEAVRGVDVIVHRGERVGLLGPNGAGKTTTLLMLLGAITPDAGTITIDGFKLPRQRSKAMTKVGFAAGYLPMSAGRGIRHSEMNASTTEPVHFVQMWVLPDTSGVDPGYEQRDINEALAKGGLVPIASGKDHEGAVSIHQRDAVLWGGRLAAGTTVDLPTDEHVHAFVALGDGSLSDDTHLSTGDAARITGSERLQFTAGPDGAELLVWATA